MTDRPKITPEHMAKLHEFAPLIGKINMSWGDCQFFVYIIFVHLMGYDPTKAEPIFFALKTDRAQRDITTALAGVVLGKHPKLLRKITTTFGNLETMAGRRNDVIHAMWGIQYDTLEPGLLAGSSSRLRGKPFKATLEETHTAIFAIAQKLSEIITDLEEIRRASP
jgi:hypothetical protein